MTIVEYNQNQYRVQDNGLVQRLQPTKNNGYTWVIVNPRKSYIECLRVINLAKGV